MKIFGGELIGTFVLVLIGCGSVAVTVLYNWLNLYQIAATWAIAVALGIFISRKYCQSHLNPAVTIGLALAKRFESKYILQAITGQFIGAFCAAITVYLIFGADISSYENENMIIRGYEASKQTAMIFGEYYPNPGNNALSSLSTANAFLFEGLGTFALMTGIFILIVIEKIPKNLLPILIGVLVGVIIIFAAPYTQAGLNPARDLAPRIFSYFAGWKDAVFSLNNMGWLTVYVIAPISGSVFSAALYRLITLKKK